ncbi:MAG: YceI family protein [Solirubrobacteraceae bacterium]
MSTTTVETVPTGTYTVDPAHSNVGFEVKHMGIATVRGAFRQFEGTIEADDGLTIDGTVEVTSVDTGEGKRDNHLRSVDFFDAENFPQITFRSTGGQADADGQLKLRGDITIRGTTRPIELTGEVAGAGEDPWGNQRVAFDLQGKLDRRDFGLTFNQALGNGNVLVGNNIKLVISASTVKGA